MLGECPVPAAQGKVVGGRGVAPLLYRVLFCVPPEAPSTKITRCRDHLAEGARKSAALGQRMAC